MPRTKVLIKIENRNFFSEYADDDAEDLSETEDEVNEEAPMNIVNIKDCF